MGPQPTISVANYFIGKAHAEGRTITPMQLLKLVYIAHGWRLGLYGEPLIAEQVQAWQYGPVVESVYQNFKHYGREPIARQRSEWGPDGNIRIPTITDETLEPFLDSVWNAYKHLDGLQLSSITHQAGTPWDVTWNHLGGARARGAVIPPERIQQHYRELSQRRNEQPANA